MKLFHKLIDLEEELIKGILKFIPILKFPVIYAVISKFLVSVIYHRNLIFSSFRKTGIISEPKAQKN